MIGSIQMLCGMGFAIGALRLLFGWIGGWKEWLSQLPASLGLVIGCGAVWWFLACAVGSETPD